MDPVQESSTRLTGVGLEGTQSLHELFETRTLCEAMPISAQVQEMPMTTSHLIARGGH